MAGNVEIQGIEFQVVGEASKAADGLKPLISSLRRLKRIAEGGLGLKSVLQEIKDFNSALGSGETPLTGFANAINQIASSGRKLGSVHSHLEGISQLDFSNLTAAAEAVGRIAQSAGGLRGITGRAGRNLGSSNLPALSGALDSGTEEAGGRTESGSVEDSFRAASEAAHSMFSNLDRDTILSFSRIDMLIAKLDILKQRMDEGLAATGKERPSDQEFTNLALQIKAIEEEIDKLNQKEVKIRFDNAMAQFNKFIDIA